MSTVQTFEKMLERGPDSALLRYSLANAYVAESRESDAIEHLTKAIELDGKYSAAWKLLGRCYFEIGDFAHSAKTYEAGIEVADGNGDKQAVKEMRVYLKRANRQLTDQSKGQGGA